MMKPKLIGFIGAPGTGKTTLACSMKEYVIKYNHSADICMEFAREHIFKHGHPTELSSNLYITLTQQDREDALLNGNNDFIFTDSPLWLSYIYASLIVQNSMVSDSLEILSYLYKRFVMDASDRYEKVFYLCGNDKVEDDGCRDMAANAKISQMIDGFVKTHINLLPIVPIRLSHEHAEERKDFVWETIRPMRIAFEGEF